MTDPKLYRPPFASPSPVSDTKSVTDRLDYIIRLLEVLVARAALTTTEKKDG